MKRQLHLEPRSITILHCLCFIVSFVFSPIKSLEEKKIISFLCSHMIPAFFRKFLQFFWKSPVFSGVKPWSEWRVLHACASYFYLFTFLPLHRRPFKIYRIHHSVQEKQNFIIIISVFIEKRNNNPKWESVGVQTKI